MRVFLFGLFMATMIFGSACKPGLNRSDAVSSVLSEGPASSDSPGPLPGPSPAPSSTPSTPPRAGLNSFRTACPPVNLEAPFRLPTTCIEWIIGAPLSPVTPIQTVPDEGDPISYTLEGVLPGGLQFDTASGTIHGNPTEKALLEVDVCALRLAHPKTCQTLRIATVAEGVILGPLSLDPAICTPDHGTGSSGDPLWIGTPGQFLSCLRAYPDRAFTLKNSIDFSAYKTETLPPFSGVLNGNGMTVKNWVALGQGPVFESLLDGAIIKNLTLETAQVTNGRGVLSNTMQGAAVWNLELKNVQLSGHDHLGLLTGIAYPPSETWGYLGFVHGISINGVTLKSDSSWVFGGLLIGDIAQKPFRVSNVRIKGVSNAISGGNTMGAVIGTTERNAQSLSNANLWMDRVEVDSSVMVSGWAITSGLIGYLEEGDTLSHSKSSAQVNNTEREGLGTGIRTGGGLVATVNPGEIGVPALIHMSLYDGDIQGAYGGIVGWNYHGGSFGIIDSVVKQVDDLKCFGDDTSSQIAPNPKCKLLNADDARAALHDLGFPRLAQLGSDAENDPFTDFYFMHFAEDLGHDVIQENVGDARWVVGDLSWYAGRSIDPKILLSEQGNILFKSFPNDGTDDFRVSTFNINPRFSEYLSYKEYFLAPGTIWSPQDQNGIIMIGQQGDLSQVVGIDLWHDQEFGITWGYSTRYHPFGDRHRFALHEVGLGANSQITLSLYQDHNYVFSSNYLTDQDSGTSISELSNGFNQEFEFPFIGDTIFFWGKPDPAQAPRLYSLTPNGPDGINWTPQAISSFDGTSGILLISKASPQTQDPSDRVVSLEAGNLVTDPFYFRTGTGDRYELPLSPDTHSIQNVVYFKDFSAVTFCTVSFECTILFSSHPNTYHALGPVNGIPENITYSDVDQKLSFALRAPGDPSESASPESAYDVLVYQAFDLSGNPDGSQISSTRILSRGPPRFALIEQGTLVTSGFGSSLPSTYLLSASPKRIRLFDQYLSNNTTGGVKTLISHPNR